MITCSWSSGPPRLTSSISPSASSPSLPPIFLQGSQGDLLSAGSDDPPPLLIEVVTVPLLPQPPPDLLDIRLVCNRSLFSQLCLLKLKVSIGYSNQLKISSCSFRLFWNLPLFGGQRSTRQVIMIRAKAKQVAPAWNFPNWNIWNVEDEKMILSVCTGFWTCLIL